MEIEEILKSMHEKDKFRKEKEKSMIIFERIQINENKPAIAQLKITVGEEIKNPLKILNKIKSCCDKLEKSFPEVEKEITLEEKELIIEARETFRMYSFLAYLEKELRSDIKEHDTVVKGSWKKFDG